MKQMPNNQKYWKERFTQLEDQLHEIAQTQSTYYMKHMERAYFQALEDIDNEISTFYRKFKTGNNLTKHEAYKLLNTKERMKFQMTLEQYIAKGKETGLNPYWMQKLENASTVYHISRLEALQFQMRQQVEILHGTMVSSAGVALSSIYNEGYLRTMYETQKGMGVGRAFAQLNQGQIDRALARPWAADGLDFSERIWGKYRPRLTYELETTLTQGIIRGRSADRIIDAMAENLGVARERTATLVMTESAFIASSAQQECLNELDVEKYEIVSALDGTTCKICGARDGEVHAMTEFLVGDTAPPFHPNCRCTTCPYFDDEFTENETRAAREGDGKTYQVPSNMKYEEWKAQHATSESDDILGHARQKIKGAISGREFVSFDGLPNDIQINFRNGLKNAENTARMVIENELGRLDFFLTDSKNFFSSKLSAIGIKRDVQPSTIAHEIFHGIDKAKNVTGRYDFRKALEEDFERLMFLSDGDVAGYLSKQYPKAFVRNNISSAIFMNREYRGISDIFSGLTENKIYLGYGHKTSYWLKNTNRLPKEAWAQYGRVLYENNSDALKMFENIFTNFNEYAKIALKELV